MNKPDAKVFVTRALSLMVAIPMTFLAAYPLVYVMLPERLQRLADLPRDLTLVLLISDVALPLFCAWLYGRARHQYRAHPGVIREKQDTRDVY